MATIHSTPSQGLRLKRLGIDTYKEAVIYLHYDSNICRSEGFEAETRIQVSCGDRSIIATLNIIHSDLLTTEEAGLSEYAWCLLDAKEGEEVQLRHPRSLRSLSFIRAKIYGNKLDAEAIDVIINDILAGYLADIHIAAFLTAGAGGRLSEGEIMSLTRTMIAAGDKLSWSSPLVVDKHCIGGVPGNRTTLIAVPIVAAFGLMIPKTSSRAITSPAGTADTMEVFAPVELDIHAMRKVVEQENGCIVWGGAVALSPADDMLIRVERALDLDSEGQLVASVLSKKIAAGSTHVLIDIPIGPTVKVRNAAAAKKLKKYLEEIGSRLGIHVRTLFTDGLQPVGRGIGPALEALDVLAVLQCDPHAPQDLRERALQIASDIIEFSPHVARGAGRKIAEDILNSGLAFKKFQAICIAQGGMREPKKARYLHVVHSLRTGKVFTINNRRLASVAKLAGAPRAKAAGVELHVALGAKVDKGQPLFTVHAESPGELAYALSFVEQYKKIIHIEENFP